MASYKVLKEIHSNGDKEKDERFFQPGQTVKDSDFSKKVIKNWLEIGVLEKKVKPKDEIRIEDGK